MVRPNTIYNIAGKSEQSHSYHTQVCFMILLLVEQADGPKKRNSCFLRANSYIFTITVKNQALPLFQRYD